MRSWDIRNLQTPIHEYKTNGGVWRIVEGENILGLGLSFANEFELVKYSDFTKNGDDIFYFYFILR